MVGALPSILLALSLVAGQGAPQAESRLDLKIRTFERVWQVVNERFYDPHFNGVDWRAAHDRYAPKVRAVAASPAFYDLLNQMLGELKQSHMRVYPPGPNRGQKQETPVQSVSIDPDAADEPGVGGMTVQIVEGQPTVTRVENGSAAAVAGIKPGFRVTEVGGMDTAWYLGDLLKDEPVQRDRWREFTWGAESLLSGSAGSRSTVKAIDAKGKERTYTLILRPPVGVPSSFGNMPTLYGRLEARRLPSGIGYVRLNVFVLPLLDKIKSTLDSFHGAKGVIVDVRGNPGGVGGIALTVAGRLVKVPTLLGVAKMRSGEFKYRAYPQDPHFDGPVAILTDECSASTSELLAGGLQECKRAIVVGRTTAGEALPSEFEKLPDGSLLQYVVAIFHTPKGALLEGRGVMPDIPVTLTRKALLTGRDPILEAAVKALLPKRSR